MLLLKIGRCCTCVHRYLLACRYSTSLSLQQKKKWKVKDIMMLANWKQECDSLFGPVIKPRKTPSSKAKTKKSSVNGSIVANISEHQQDNDEADYFGDILAEQKPSVDQESISADKSVTSDQNSYQGGSDFGNYSEIKILTVSELEMHHTDQNVSEKLTAKTDHATKPQAQGLEDAEKMPCSDDLSSADDVCDYQWVEKLPDQIFNGASGTKPSTSGAHAMKNSEMQNHGQIANIKVKQRYSSTGSPILEAVKMKDIDTSIMNGSDKSTISSYEQHASELSATTQKYISEQSESDDNISSFPLFVVDKNENLSEISNSPYAQTTRLPSVTKILKATQSSESKLALERWEKQMISQLGAEGFAKYKEDLFKNGANFHANIELFLTGRQEMMKVLPAIEGHWQSVEAVINEVTSVQCVEQPIRHSQLGYCGVVDCVAEYRGEMCVIEWKTSERRKSNIKFTYDNPVQLVAYLGAYNFQPGSHLQVERCLLVIGYDDGNAADVHVMNKRDCLLYWKEWLQRLSAYRRLNG